jgi:hypothetical protein
MISYVRNKTSSATCMMNPCLYAVKICNMYMVFPSSLDVIKQKAGCYFARQQVYVATNEQKCIKNDATRIHVYNKNNSNESNNNTIRKSEKLFTACSSSFLFPANPTIVSPETRRRLDSSSGGVGREDFAR